MINCLIYIIVGITLLIFIVWWVIGGGSKGGRNV